MKNIWGVIAALIVALGVLPSAHAVVLDKDAANTRTALAVVSADGSVDATANGREPRPALSLSKLYLGYWVLYNGSDYHKSLVEEMIRVSHDGYASQLDRAYPQAIGEIANQFSLNATSRNGRWGATTTSAVDVARFIHEIKSDPVATPLLNGMRNAAPVAADGFAQNYGTHQLPGVQGTKFGWADDRYSAMATVSFGEDWTAAALTYGNAEANTVDARAALKDRPAHTNPVITDLRLPQLPLIEGPFNELSSQLPGVPQLSDLPALPEIPELKLPSELSTPAQAQLLPLKDSTNPLSSLLPQR